MDWVLRVIFRRDDQVHNTLVAKLTAWLPLGELWVNNFHSINDLAVLESVIFKMHRHKPEMSR